MPLSTVSRFRHCHHCTSCQPPIAVDKDSVERGRYTLPRSEPCHNRQISIFRAALDWFNEQLDTPRPLPPQPAPLGQPVAGRGHTAPELHLLVRRRINSAQFSGSYCGGNTSPKPSESASFLAYSKLERYNNVPVPKEDSVPRKQPVWVTTERS